MTNATLAQIDTLKNALAAIETSRENLAWSEGEIAAINSEKAKLDEKIAVLAAKMLTDQRAINQALVTLKLAPKSERPVRAASMQRKRLDSPDIRDKARGYLANNDHAVTTRQLADAIGLRPTSAVPALFARLANQGVIHRSGVGPATRWYV